MDYYQGVVADYLSADPAVFVKPECSVRLNSGGGLKKGEHWYCDIVAVNLRTKTVYLCEVTCSQTLATLLKRLGGWAANWPALREALVRDNHVPENYGMRPWVFVPRKQHELALSKISKLFALRLGADARGEGDGPRGSRPLAVSVTTRVSGAVVQRVGRVGAPAPLARVR